MRDTRQDLGVRVGFRFRVWAKFRVRVGSGVGVRAKFRVRVRVRG